MPQSALRFAVVAALGVLLAQDAGAQRPKRTQRKPFAAFSESAQRLKDSVATRLHADGGLVVAPILTPSPYIEVATQEMILRDSLLATARSQLGAKYRLGAERPGKAFDCSGLVRFVLSALRVELPRTAHEQGQLGREVPRDVAALKPGDLLTFGSAKRITHIGIYAGGGRVIHASVTKREVIETTMDRLGPSLLKQWHSARRLIAMAADTLAS